MLHHVAFLELTLLSGATRRAAAGSQAAILPAQIQLRPGSPCANWPCAGKREAQGGGFRIEGPKPQCRGQCGGTLGEGNSRIGDPRKLKRGSLPLLRCTDDSPCVGCVEGLHNNLLAVTAMSRTI